jgi:PIN domain nuclease of toxin-antitoxin system
MKLLLDTHVFLWLDSALERVPQRAREACQDGANEVFLSLASVWEMQIKTSLGKLRLPVAPVDLVTPYFNSATLRALAVELAHIRELGGLPANHGDHFDRMLVAQARHEGLVLVTADRVMREYAVEVLWE